jgi:hypothetical protein
MRIIFLLLLSFCLLSCNTSVDDLIDIIDVPRKDIDTSRMGVNAFANDARFGSIQSQMLEVRDTLDLSYVRILFSWTNAVQPTPGSTINFSFFDDLVAAVPAGVDALIVVTGLPSWMGNSANWVENNPRTTFVENFVRPIINRYKGNARIVGWQIWNEPNMVANGDNVTLDIATAPANYVEMLARASNVAKSLTPSKLVVSAATTAINQNYSETLEYNRSLRDAGMQAFIDVYAIHIYGKQYENIVRDGGIRDYLNGLSKPIWVTESGAQGVTSQLAYCEEMWPFLIDRVNGLQRFYYYQLTEATPAAATYGLRNLDAGSAISDLYIFLRDR